MKRIFAIFAVLALLVLALAGCGEKKDDKKDNVLDDAQNGAEDGILDGTDGAEGGSAADDGALNENGAARGRSYTANAAGSSQRAVGSDKAITHENGNLYGKTYLTPETDKSANAQLRSNGRSLTGMTKDELSGDDLRYQQMLENGRVRDTDGFLLDGENTSYNTLR